MYFSLRISPKMKHNARQSDNNCHFPGLKQILLSCMTILFQESEFVISMPDNLAQIAKWLEYSNKRRTTNYGLNNAVVFLDEVTLVSVLC